MVTAKRCTALHARDKSDPDLTRAESYATSVALSDDIVHRDLPTVGQSTQ